MKIPTKSIERSFFNSGFSRVIGVDEVGIGCLAGPVVVCAISFSPALYLKPSKKLSWIRDSKLLSEEKRNEFARILMGQAGIKYSICYSYPKTIDKVNIYWAARKAMKRAVLNLKEKNAIILVDGNLPIQNLSMPQKAVIKGDRKVFAIACASVLAKVFRDRMMKKYAKKYPGYGFEVHKGYATKYHYVQLASLGPSKIHRGSFRLS